MRHDDPREITLDGDPRQNYQQGLGGMQG